jgi:hypothetical protein
VTGPGAGGPRLIGMVHLPAMPGTPAGRGRTIEEVVDGAVRVVGGQQQGAPTGAGTVQGGGGGDDGRALAGDEDGAG